MKNSIILFVALFVASTVSFGQTKKEKKKLKEEKKEQDFQEMKDLINSGTYEFDGQWAISHRGRRINLTTNPTFIKMNHKEANAFLPFFGERYSGAASYGGDSGIEFNNQVSDYEVSFNEKKKQVIVKFIGEGKTDTFSFKMIVFPNGNTNITVTSNHRSLMRYDGLLKELVLEEKN